MLLDGVGWSIIFILACAGAVGAFCLLYLMQQRTDPLLPAWVIPACMAVGIPIALAIWKHPTAPRRAIPTALILLSVINALTVGVTVVMVPFSVAAAFRRAGLIAIDRLGVEDPRAQLASALGMGLADRLHGRVQPHDTGPFTASPDADAPAPAAPLEGLYVNFDPNTTGITVPATLMGPDGVREVSYLFDTGATFTTITPKLAAQLGIDVRRDAPTQSFNTAKGKTETPMVFLDALTLGDVTIEGVLVSICDTCATEKTEGLLGLNVTRNFVVEMDYQREQMHLDPRNFSEDGNRGFDIRHVVDLSLAGSPEIYRGYIAWTLQIENKASRDIYDVIPGIEFTTGASMTGEVIPRIPAGEQVSVLIRGRAFDTPSTGPVEFVLSLEHARWNP